MWHVSQLNCWIWLPWLPVKPIDSKISFIKRIPLPPPLQPEEQQQRCSLLSLVKFVVLFPLRKVLLFLLLSIIITLNINWKKLLIRRSPAVVCPLAFWSFGSPRSFFISVGSLLSLWCVKRRLSVQGITMIGTESKSFYHDSGQFCNFIITDIRGYVLTLMWIIITIFSLLITVRYIHKILKEVSLKRRTNQPLLSLSILGQSHGQSIASRDILMQQIEQRIQLNILLIILFILFWFPLFLVTLSYIKFKIPENLLR